MATAAANRAVIPGSMRIRALVGLYLKHPAHAAVFCVDEKIASQALDRLDAVRPLSPGAEVPQV